MTKTLQKLDPEADAQRELAEAERAMKAGKLTQDELIRLHAIALNKVLSFRYIRDGERQQQAELERLAKIAQRQQAAKDERAAAIDQLIESRKAELVRHHEAGNEAGCRCLRATIEELKQKRALALA